MSNDLQIISISGIDCYERDGTAYLKLDTVARGLGFTQEKGGVEYVRWETVDRYLREIGFPSKLGKEDLPKNGERPEFIPENIFYRLAMKAKNEAAEAFQAKIADEVIPAIRKTGGYTRKPMTTNEMFAMQAQINLESERKLAALEGKVEKTSNAVMTALNTFAAPPTDEERWRDEMNRRVRAMCEEYGLNYHTTIGDMYAQLEDRARVNLTARQKNLRERMRLGGAKYAQREAVSKLVVISQDAKLRCIYETIVREKQAQLAASRLRAI